MTGEKGLGDLELDLRIIMRDLEKNPENFLSFQAIATLYNQTKDFNVTSLGPEEIQRGEPVVTLYLKDKYAEFHNELPKIAHEIETLRPLIKYLESNGWDYNLDS